MNKKCMLVILDGWGHGKKDDSDAIFCGNTPFVDSLYDTCPNAELLTDGENVGLPQGQMGNSEVGHMNIGAGRIVYQDLLRINREIESGAFLQNTVLKEVLTSASKSGQRVHFMGLIGDGGVHAHQSHLFGLIDFAEQEGVEEFYVHAFMDGRDTDPRSGEVFLADLEHKLDSSRGKLASVSGRYYAMDRDKRWERVALAYNALVNGEGQAFGTGSEGLAASYDKGVTDEFVVPFVIHDSEGETIAQVQEGDLVVCFNFRTDRCREITMALTQESFPAHGMSTIDLDYVTMTRYDDTFKNIQVAYDKDDLRNTLGEVLAGAGKTQLRMAETEKYPHVTFFFSGGREEPFEGENRIVVNSPKVATYDLQPEMSAFEVRDEAIEFIRESSPDFVCLNFANPDMVGHTGVFEAIKKAVETVDGCLKAVVDVARELDYAIIVIADHGNADFAVNPNGSPNTAHSLNPVPVFLINHEVAKIDNGVLANVAPTVLDILGVEAPKEMTHKSLL